MGCASTVALMIAAPESDFLPPTSPSRSTAAISLRASRRNCASWAWPGKASDLRTRRRSPLQPEPQHQHGCGVVRARLSRAIELAAGAGFENDGAVEVVIGRKAETRRDVPKRRAGVVVRQIPDRAGQREIAAQGMVVSLRLDTDFRVTVVSAVAVQISEASMSGLARFGRRGSW